MLEIIFKPFMFLLTPIKAWFTTQYKVSNYWVHMTSTTCSPYLHKDDCVPLTSSVQSLSRVPLFATPWIAARQASLSIHHHLPEFTQTHIHQVGDAIQPSRPLLSPFPPVPNPSQHKLQKKLQKVVIFSSFYSFIIITIKNYWGQGMEGWSVKCM